jgi:hypothetical protein
MMRNYPCPPVIHSTRGITVMFVKHGPLVTAIVSTIALCACAQMSGGGSTKPDSASTSSSSGRVGPGMNANGEVMDPTKVEAGYGQKVKGINDYEGEITGVIAPNSGFAQLKIGMGFRQVIDILGQPTDRGAYITGKAFIPFYFGGDRYRSELLYKGQGRLIFAGGSFGDYSGGGLIWIISSTNESGYR